MIKLFSWSKEVRKSEVFGTSKTFTFTRGARSDAMPEPSPHVTSETKQSAEESTEEDK